MCACRQKKSFLIEDILFDNTKNKAVKKSNDVKTSRRSVDVRKDTEPKVVKSAEKNDGNTKYNENVARFNVMSEVQNEIDRNKVNLELRRNTYPLYPAPVKPLSWYRKEVSCPYRYCSEQMLHTDQILRSQLTNTWMPHAYNVRQNFGCESAGANWCSPWWGVAGRRKGGQVRFTAAQTNALERRFSASIYLSPDERRALAASLRLSDRQVKTWFQNRRAKWRRTTPDAGDSCNSQSPEESDDDALI